MDIVKHERARGILKQAVAEYLKLSSNRKSLITVTELEITDNEKFATVLISVLPDSSEQAVLDFINRNLGEMRKYVGLNSKLRTIPYFTVEIDKGEKNRQRIDTLLIRENVPPERYEKPESEPRPKRKKKVS